MSSTMTRKKTLSSVRVVVLLLAFCSSTTEAFPISSSKSSRKNRVQPRKKNKQSSKQPSSNRSGGGGFGKQQSQQPTLTHIPDTSPEIQTLIQFLSQNKALGLELDQGGGIQVGFGGGASDDDEDNSQTGRRGVFATEKYKKGELLCQIPSDLGLALSDPAQKGDDVPTMAHVGRNFLQMYAKNDQAKQQWKPYLDTLPSQEQHFTATPDFFTNEELALLEFPRVISRANDRKFQIQELAATTSSDGDFTMEELQFATWLVSSRCFPISLSDSDDKTTTVDEEGNAIMKAADAKIVRVLIPFLDLVNHASNGPNVELHLIDPEKDDAWFALRALKPIQPGRELLLSYGTGIESSVELLLNYGFVPRENKIDPLMLGKGGTDCLTTVEDWTTTLEEDEFMLGEMMSSSSSAEEDEGTNRLRTILEFRKRLKKACMDLKNKQDK